jgi:hypothetical protein
MLALLAVGALLALGAGVVGCVWLYLFGQALSVQLDTDMDRHGYGGGAVGFRRRLHMWWYYRHVAWFMVVEEEADMWVVSSLLSTCGFCGLVYVWCFG